MSSVGCNEFQHGFIGKPPRRFSRLSAAAILLASTAALAPAAFAASENLSTVYGKDLTALSNDELRRLRGGVRVAGVDFDFGAIVHLNVNGALVAETTFSMNQDGSLSHTTTIHDSSIASEFTGDPTQLAGTNIQLNGSNGGMGIVIKDGSGVSVTMNKITAGEMNALLANGAPDRVISQTVEGTLTINNFSQLNNNMMTDIATARAMAAAIGGVVMAQ
ncbi:MAG: hypothetical protein E6Q98_11295 [Rhodospirillaceae bacterium]|nr:MAG: hypothetical protein E6Q98_11295 [Rhodospirillaceae bacterium]